MPVDGPSSDDHKFARVWASDDTDTGQARLKQMPTDGPASDDHQTSRLRDFVKDYDFGGTSRPKQMPVDEPSFGIPTARPKVAAAPMQRAQVMPSLPPVKPEPEMSPTVAQTLSELAAVRPGVYKLKVQSQLRKDASLNSDKAGFLAADAIAAVTEVSEMPCGRVRGRCGSGWITLNLDKNVEFLRPIGSGGRLESAVDRQPRGPLKKRPRTEAATEAPGVVFGDQPSDDACFSGSTGERVGEHCSARDARDGSAGPIVQEVPRDDDWHAAYADAAGAAVAHAALARGAATRSPSGSGGANGLSPLTLPEVLKDPARSARGEDSSKLLQMALSSSSARAAHDRGIICDALLPEALALSYDVFGNYVIMALLEKSAPHVVKAVLTSMLGHIVELARDKHGCRVLQQVIRMLPDIERMRVEAELNKGMLSCIKCSNGNRVIQTAVEHGSSSFIRAVIAYLRTDAVGMAKRDYACRVIMRLLPRCNEIGLMDDLDPLVQPLLGAVRELMGHQLGHYVVQSLVEHGRLDDQMRIVDVVRSNIIEISSDSIASSVAARCVKAMAANGRSSENELRFGALSALVRTFIGDADDTDSPLRTLVGDKFGSRVVQSVIKHCNGEDKELLRQRIEKLRTQMAGALPEYIVAVVKDKFG